ncbi:MAG: DUF4178 domain-containing protein [Gemmataceae bacterium]
MSIHAQCPACGGPVSFHVNNSLVTVCPYCQSVVGRSDRGLESLGKVADLVETQSPLSVGIKGRFEGVPFDLTGRTQFKHPAGGVWDEWYAALADGRWGWLAEAQGRFYLTFEHQVSDDFPPYEKLELGQNLEVLPGVTLLVAEKNRATVGSAQGEIPERVVPGSSHPFVDLSGPAGEFGTISYEGNKPTLYLGRQVNLDELHIPHQVRRTYPGLEPRIQAVHLNCPQCGGALELRAPDRSERVGCPNCGALSDVREGKLSLLRALEPPSVQPILPLGSTGKREGVEWMVIGFLDRYVTVEGEDYHWEEYLLYQPRLGFRWLTRSDEHWNWVEAVPPASVRVDGNTAYYADRWYRLFQSATAKVAYVAGEFYWKVEAGEKVRGRDYVQPPFMLSSEETRTDNEGEINWSAGTYLPRGEVEAMFGLRSSLPAPQNIGPNQPFPYTGIYSASLVLIGLALLLAAGLWLITSRKVVYQAKVELNALPEGQRSHKIIEPEPVHLQRWRNMRVVLTPRADAGWAFIQGSLVPAVPAPIPGVAKTPTTTERRDFAFIALPGQPAYVYLGALPAGPYTLQYEIATRNPLLPTGAEVSIEQGVSHPYPLVVTLFLLAVGPIVLGLYQVWFESRRWSESNVG